MSQGDDIFNPTQVRDVGNGESASRYESTAKGFSVTLYCSCSIPTWKQPDQDEE